VKKVATLIYAPRLEKPSGAIEDGLITAYHSIIADDEHVVVELVELLLSLVHRYADLHMDLLSAQLKSPSLLAFPLWSLCLRAGLPKQSICATLQVPFPDSVFGLIDYNTPSRERVIHRRMYKSLCSGEDQHLLQRQLRLRVILKLLFYQTQTLSSALQTPL
jgi:hypothetical protein